MSPEKLDKEMISLMLCLLEHKIFTQLNTYCPTYYCPNTMVILLPQGEDFQHKCPSKDAVLLLCVYRPQWNFSIRFIKQKGTSNY